MTHYRISKRHSHQGNEFGWPQVLVDQAEDVRIQVIHQAPDNIDYELLITAYYLRRPFSNNQANTEMNLIDS